MNEIPEEERKSDLDRIKKATAELAEHFDSVQILATRCESGRIGGTVKVSFGAGNWYARYGQIKEWILQEEEASRNKIMEDNQ